MTAPAERDELLSLAKRSLLRLNDRREAYPFLAAYDMRVQFDVTDGEPFHAVLAGGRVEAVRAGRMENGFRLVFEGRITPAAAMYYGRVTPRGERAKHNQAAVVYTLLHIAQKPEYLVADPGDVVG